MPSLGAGEMIVIFVLVLVLFGPHRLPELARGAGRAMREVRKITSDFQSQLAAIADIEDEPKTSRPVVTDEPPVATAPRLDQMSSTPWTPPQQDFTPNADRTYNQAEDSGQAEGSGQTDDAGQGTLPFADSGESPSSEIPKPAPPSPGNSTMDSTHV